MIEGACFPVDDCTADACGDGESCQAVVIKSCFGAACDACGAERSVCLPDAA